MRSLSAAYLLRQVCDLRLKVAVPPSPRRRFAAYEISRNAIAPLMKHSCFMRDTVL